MTTPEFLAIFDLQSLRDLPELPDEIGEAVFDSPDLCILRAENNNEIFATEPAKAE